MTDTPDRNGGGIGGPGEGTALAAEYVLSLMDPVSRAEFEDALARSPDLRAEVAFWEAELAGMAVAELAPVTPPAQLRTRLMDGLFPPQPRQRLWQSVLLWRGLTTAALVLAAGLGWQLYRAKAPVPLLVGEIAAENETQLRLLAVYDGADGSLRLTRTDGVAAPGRSLELWAIAGEAAPVSLGLLDEAAQGRVVLPEALRGEVGAITFAISDEPEGGSPTGAPTGAVLALGRLDGV